MLSENGGTHGHDQGRAHRDRVYRHGPPGDAAAARRDRSRRRGRHERGSGRRAAAKFGIAGVHDSAAALLADPGVEVVHNCAPNNVHFDINAAAIMAGKEVLSEKPLALDSKESGELMALAEKRGTLTAINFCYRYYPVVQEAAARARRGDLGTSGLSSATSCRIGSSSRPIIPGGSIPRSPARPMSSPTSAATGATSSSSSPERRSSRSCRASHLPAQARKPRRGLSRSAPAGRGIRGGRDHARRLRLALLEALERSRGSFTTLPGRRRPQGRHRAPGLRVEGILCLEPRPPQRPLDRTPRKGQRGLLRIVPAAGGGHAEIRHATDRPSDGLSRRRLQSLPRLLRSLRTKREGKAFRAAFPDSGPGTK